MNLQKQFGNPVFTLQSIKSRIETIWKGDKISMKILFLLYSPLNQGLKPDLQVCRNCKKSVFTLQSIKSRIETWTFSWSIVMNLIVFTLQSIKSRIETQGSSGRSVIRIKVFTLQSIKSRIETKKSFGTDPILSGFYSTVH